MPDYNVNDSVKLGGLKALALRTKTELTTLETKINATFKSLSVSGNTVSFYGSTDGTGTALATFDFPEELFLDQASTTLAQNFAWSAATYPGSTNPNLDGKTVLVLGVKGDATTPTVKYSFVSLEKLIDIYTAGDNSIDIDGYSVSVKISATTGNLLELKNDGLFVGSDDSKIDKVTNAVTGNFATWGTSGALIDSGVTFASDTDVNAMITEVFGA